MSSGSRQAGGAANSSTRVSSGKKRGRVAWSGSAEESEDSDSAGSANQRSSSRPKKRFIWPEVRTDRLAGYTCSYHVHRQPRSLLYSVLTVI